MWFMLEYLVIHKFRPTDTHTVYIKQKNAAMMSMPMSTWTNTSMIVMYKQKLILELGQADTTSQLLRDCQLTHKNDLCSSLNLHIIS
jgi:hypothetical protein